MHKILVYGSSGFLGTKLVKYFVSKKYYVSKDSKNFKNKLKKKKKYLQFIFKRYQKKQTRHHYKFSCFNKCRSLRKTKEIYY